MRVAYVHPFAQEVSGPDESLLALLEPLIRKGISAHLIVPRLGPAANRYRALGVELHESPLTALRRSMAVPEAIGFVPQIGRQAFLLARILKSIRAEVVHTNMEVLFQGGMAARVLRLPHVLHYRGNTLDRPRRVFDVLTRVWTAIADHIFCISEATAEVFRRRHRADKVEVLYNPVQLDTFASAERSNEVRAELGAGPADCLVVTVGRIHPRKDFETFVRAAALVADRVPEARFAVVGVAAAPEELEYERRLRAIVAELGLASRFRFAGARADIAAVMKAADLMVLASRHEGFGRVVAEAMAAGRPVVVSREGALPELVQEPRFGRCARPADAADFAERVVELLRTPADRQRMSQAAAERARLFDANVIGGRVFACYERLLAASRL